MAINERFSKMVVMPIPVIGEYTAMSVTPIFNTSGVIVDDTNHIMNLTTENTELNVSSINTINASVSNLWINGKLFSYDNLNTDSIILNSASITNLSNTNANIGNISGTNASFFNASFTTAYVTQLYLNGIPFSTEHISQDYAFFSTASVTNLSATNASIVNISGTSAYYTTLSCTNACIYN